MKFQYTLIRSKRKTIAVQVDSDCNITVRAPLRMSQNEIDEFLAEKKIWLEKAKEIIPKKVEYYSEIMDVKPTSVKINSAKKRYGSCSGKNSLNFSLYLMDKDERFIDYVVVHELAHIKHHNHSKDFYNFIAEFMPDYKERMKL